MGSRAGLGVCFSGNLMFNAPASASRVVFVLMRLASNRKLFYLGLATLVLVQLGGGILEYALYPRVLATLITASLVTLGISLVLLILTYHRLKVSDSQNANMLAGWIRAIDLSSPSATLPALPAQTASTAQIASATRELAERVYAYREKLLVRHQRVQRLLRNVTDVLYHTDAAGHLTWVTDSVLDMLGYTPIELENRPLSDILADPDNDFRMLLESPQLWRQPIRVHRKDGGIAWLLVSSRRIDDSNGNALGSEGVCRDGTRLIETQQALDQEKERAQVTLASIGDGVVTTDAHGVVDYLNPRARQMLETPPGAAIAVPFDDLCHLVDTASRAPLAGIVGDCIVSGVAREWEDNIALCDQNGLNLGKAVKVTIAPIRNAHETIVGTVIALHDITRLQQISREMSYQANHDVVTGLPNRRAFETRLAQFKERVARENSEHALCYVDLDQFKLVNDTCGHDAGDEMLRQIAALLRARLRANDTIARLGGDEFGVLMEDLSITAAHAKADILRSEIDTFRFRWNDKLFRLSASIGLAAIDGTAVSVTELLRRADTACYMAKEKGRNQVHAYHGDSDETQTQHGDMERMQQISEALDNNRFVLFAQIIQPLTPDSDTRCGVELLLRMRDRNGSIQGPQNFLITAERYNAAARIDRWVLRRSLQLITEADHHQGQIDHYSVNISAQSITDEHFVGHARQLIESSHVDPGRLVFEITETAAVTNTLRAGELIRSLRALGCRFSLDDFGSGLSSFSYLKDLPSDFIKIDGKLVRDILLDPVESSIVQAINQVGQAMGLKTVAERVESRALLEGLRRIGVDYVQGYYVARPVPFAELAGVLALQRGVTDNDSKPRRGGQGAV